MEDQHEPEPEFWLESNHNIKNSNYTSKSWFLIWSFVRQWIEPKLSEPHQEPFIHPLYFSEIESECEQLAIITPLLGYHRLHRYNHDIIITTTKKELIELYLSKSIYLAIRDSIDYISFIQKIHITMSMIKHCKDILKQSKKKLKYHTEIYNKLMYDAIFIIDILGLTSKHVEFERNIKRINWKYNKYLLAKSIQPL